MNKKLNETTIIDLESLICLSNIDINLKPIDTMCLESSTDNGKDFLKILGHIDDNSGADKQKYIGKYLVVADEIVSILDYTFHTENELKFTKVEIDRRLFGTSATENLSLKHCRLVEILGLQGSEILSYNFTDTIGVPNNELFPVELSTGSLVFTDNLKKWSPLSEERQYEIKPRNTVVYIFKGQNNTLMLKNIALTDRAKFSTGNLEVKKITLPLKNYLYKWYNLPVNSKEAYTNLTPRQFFMKVFNLSVNDVYYADGVEEENLIKCSNLPLGSFKQYSELLKAYCNNTTVRFIFDRFERVKVFSDYNVSNIQGIENFKETISDIIINDDSKLVFNSFKSEVNQYQTLYRFTDLDESYVNYKMRIKNAFMSNTMLLHNGEGYYPNIIIIDSDDMFEKCYLGDYVLAKCTWGDRQEFHGKVMRKIQPNRLELQFFRWDKDYLTLVAGKDEYLNTLLNASAQPMDLYYIRYELPDVFRFSRNRRGTEKDFQLQYPILPLVDSKEKYKEVVAIKFGSASNLKNAEYSGSIEGIDGIYGTWESNRLPYNMEYEQSKKGSPYPPIYLLSNKIREMSLGGSFTYKYTSFDNSNVRISIAKGTGTQQDSDAILSITNTMNVTSNSLRKGRELSRVGDSIIEVASSSTFSIGDVLIVNEPTDNPTDLELEEYRNLLSSIKWVVRNRWEDNGKHYILLDSPFAKRNFGKTYEFTVFPVDKIVYIQELYIKGNPLLKSKQEVAGVGANRSKTGISSVELYDERPYPLQQSMLDKTEIKKLMGYILYNFDGVNNETTKYLLPLQLVNSLHLEVLDVITVDDPYYTNINKDTYKWLILSIKISHETNTAQLHCINLNAKNSKPYEMEVKDLLEFRPVEVPKYTNTGVQEDIGDGQSDSEKDEDIGQIWVSKIDESEITAVVEKYENGYLYFTDFNGSKKEEYKEKLFKRGIEFVVDIEGEMIFVEADSPYRAIVKKRKLYKTEKADLLPKSVVKFLNISLHTDVDGTIYGRRIHIGDNNHYFKFDPLTGASFSGNFTIGAGANNNNNDLYRAVNRNQTFRQPDEPTTDLRDGDTWYNTAENNKVYIYNGKEWLPSQYSRQAYSVEISKIIYADKLVQNNVQDNDFLVNVKNDRIYLRKNGQWIDFTTEKALSVDNNTVIHSKTEPTASSYLKLKDGDIWFNSDNGYIRKVYKNGAWVDNRDDVVKTSLNGRYIFVDETQPTTWRTKDIWIKFNNRNAIVVNPNSTESESPVPLDNGKRLFIEDKYPQGDLKSFDLWVDTSNNYVIYYYENGKWNTSNSNIYDYIDLKSKENSNLTTLDKLNNFSKIVTQDLETIQNQVDGAIETWYDDPIPTLSNYPASLWEYVATKEKHIGDLYYDGLGRGYRFERYGATFRWKEIKDKDIIKALADAQQAQDTADGKRKVFVVEPTHPYNIGDLWIKNKELYVATADSVAVFDPNEWVKATKYTDDTSLEAYKRLIDPQIVNLQEQVDGKIETYLQTSDPKVNWTTAQLKTIHKGDIWHNPNTKLTYRWNGTQWVELEQKGEDLLARELAERKATIFTKQPTPPYNIGDLWLKDGKMYKATVNKDKGSLFNTTDWDLATAYTDDTKANQVSDELKLERERQYWLSRMIHGKMLYTDPEFKEGHNSIEVYNNSRNGTVTHARSQKANNDSNKPPNTSNFVIEITKNNGISRPGLGGFYFATPTRKEAVFITKIVAKIPKGYEIDFASNSIGNGTTALRKWLTQTIGTGYYEEYIHFVRCGVTEPFSSTNFFYIRELNGSGGEINTTTPITWYVAYATVFDCVANSEDSIVQFNKHLRNADGQLSALEQKYEQTKQSFNTLDAKLTGATSSFNEAIRNGNLIINNNTVFTGDLNIASRKNDSRMVLNADSIDFYRTVNGREYKLTSIRNIVYGTIITNYKGVNPETGNPATVTFTGFKSPMFVMTSIKTANFGYNMASVLCFSELTDPSSNTYRFYIGGTNEKLNPTKMVSGGTSLTFKNALYTKFESFTFKIDDIWFEKIGDNKNYSSYRGGIPLSQFIKTTISHNSNAVYYLKSVTKLEIHRKDNDTTSIIYKGYIHSGEMSFKGSWNHNHWEYSYGGFLGHMHGIPLKTVNLNVEKQYFTRQNITYTLKLIHEQPHIVVSNGSGWEYTHKYNCGADGSCSTKKGVFTANDLVKTINDGFITGVSIKAGANESTLSGAIGQGEVSYIAVELAY